MSLEDTNIIPDDQFLDEILNTVKKKPEVVVEEDKDELDELLGIKKQGPPKENEPPKKEGEADSEESETTQDSVEDQDTVEEEEKAISRRFGVKDTVTALIENETWEDMPVKYGDKEYESISELIEKEKPTKELFDMLSQAQKGIREEQIKDSYIKVTDKESTQYKLASAILEGVDYTDLVQNYNEVIEPLTKIDFAHIDNGDEVAAEFVAQCLIEIDGYHPASVAAVVQDLKNNFRLIQAAEDYQHIAIEKFNQEVESRKQAKIEAEIAQAEAVKQEMKALRQELKAQEVADSFSAKILKLRYSQDPNSGKYHYESLIQDKLKDKGFEARLMHFLLDEKDFLEKVKAPVKQQSHKKILELMRIAPSGKGSAKTSNKQTGNLETADEDFLRDLGLM